MLEFSRAFFVHRALKPLRQILRGLNNILWRLLHLSTLLVVADRALNGWALKAKSLLANRRLLILIFWRGIHRVLVRRCQHCFLVHLIRKWKSLFFEKFHHFFGLRHSGRLNEVDRHIIDSVVPIIYFSRRLAWYFIAQSILIGFEPSNLGLKIVLSALDGVILLL